MIFPQNYTLQALQAALCHEKVELLPRTHVIETTQWFTVRDSPFRVPGKDCNQCSFPFFKANDGNQSCLPMHSSQNDIVWPRHESSCSERRLAFTKNFSKHAWMQNRRQPKAFTWSTPARVPWVTWRAWKRFLPLFRWPWKEPFARHCVDYFKQLNDV